MPLPGTGLANLLTRAALLVPSMQVLVFNCGSSSLKFDLIALDPALPGRGTLVRGVVEEIGPNASHTFFDRSGARISGSRPVHDHAEAARIAVEWIESALPGEIARLDAVAHRIVHGGDELVAPRLVDSEVMRALERASEFAPLHNPPAIAVVRALQERLPRLPVAVIADTAFHRTLPAHARSYAIPHTLAERHGIRRYGFHGIGHAWMMDRYAELSATPAAQLDLVTLHLGAGCSVTAIRGARSVDTSMGLTPLEGLMMATRSGDIDPAIITRLAERENLTPAEVERILNRESGLLGVSGISSDMRDVRRAELDGNARAALAIEMFCHRARKYVGAYLATLGRADAIIFGGGIGEHAEWLRTRICAGLEGFGVMLDDQRNRAANGREGAISSDASRIKVYVIPLDEELYMARAAAALVKGDAAGVARSLDSEEKQ